jgi:HSP20 family molecular chaperone IbpA
MRLLIEPEALSARTLPTVVHRIWKGGTMALPILRRNGDDARAGSPPARLDTRGELEELRDRLDRIMQSIWQPAAGALETGLGWAPAVDVEEADDAWIVEAELPGIEEKDINLELHGTELSISGDIESAGAAASCVARRAASATSITA